MNTKTRRFISISVSVILVAAIVLTFSWFYVRGAELRFLQDIPADCEASVSIWTWDGTDADDNKYESVLTQEQLSQIFDLLQSSSYWRDPASSITHHEKTTYTVFVPYESDGKAQFLSITISGGYAVLMNSSQDFPFENDFLRIQDKNWVAKLDAILAYE